MTTLMMIFGGILIGLGAGLMKSGLTDKKSLKSKKNNKWTPRHLPYRYNHLFRS